MLKRLFTITCALTALAAAPLAGQARNTECLRALSDLDRPPADSASVCLQLAVFLFDAMTEGFFRNADPDEVVNPRDLQSTSSGAAGTGGSLAQGEAVPTVQPMALAGGSIAAVGSDAGANAITAITLNPSIFFNSSKSVEETARWSRLTDLTVFFPVDGLDQDEDGDVDYFGVRARVNLTGLSAGSQIAEGVRAAFNDVLQQEGRNVITLESVLLQAPSVEACASALRSAEAMDAPEVTTACGSVSDVVIDEAAYERLRDQLRAVREEADSKYLGLDFRLDVGDPTLGAVPNASATALTGGLAFGRRFVGGDPDGPSGGIKGRVGLRYIDLEDLDETHFALDGGIAFEARRPFETRQVSASGGFEFRFGDADLFEEQLQTNFLVFRASLAVPITAATDISLNLGAPLIGDISPVLSINANWGLLLPDLARR